VELAIAVEGNGHTDVIEDQHRLATATFAQMRVALGRVAFAAAHERGEQRSVSGALRAVLARRGRRLHGTGE